MARNCNVDARQGAVERALKVEALRRLAREIGIAEAVAALASGGGADNNQALTPREVTAASRTADRAEMVAELDRLERGGRGRAAVMMVARKFARDPLDPVEVESLARKLRRWRPKNFGHCPVVSLEG